MRIMITGAKGQLGTELSTLLDSTHHDVLGVDLDHGRNTLDITDRDLTVGAICEWRPELILHGAAFTAVDRCETEPETAYLVNSLATRSIADGARRVDAHVVYLSTDYVFDGTKSGPYVEWDQPCPQSIYGASKLGGEMEIDPAWTIARTSWVCSPHGANMVKTVMGLASGTGPLSFVDDQVGNPTFADDLAAMVLKLGVGRMPGTFHVTNAGSVSWYEFVREILMAAGGEPERVLPITTAELSPPRPARRPANSVLDNMALRHSGLGELDDFRIPLRRCVDRLLA